MTGANVGGGTGPVLLGVAMPKKATMSRRASVQVENFQAPVVANAEQAKEQEMAAVQAQVSYVVR